MDHSRVAASWATARAARRDTSRPSIHGRPTCAGRLAEEQGQGLAEYALILALIAIVSVAALIFFGTELSTLLSEIGSAVGDVT